MADYTIEVAVPNVGPQGPQGPAGEFGELEAPEDGIIYGRKDAEWVDMTAPANLQVRRGTASEATAITPLEGEPIWATDSKILYVGDGETVGGIQIGNYPIFGSKPTGNTGAIDAGKIKIADALNQSSPNVLGGTRGGASVDLQFVRSSSNQIASGNGSVIIGGTNNTASGLNSSIVGGFQNSATANFSTAFGQQCVASAKGSVACGQFSIADRPSMFSFGGEIVGYFNSRAQSIEWVFRGITENATPAVLKPSDTDLATIPEGVVLFATVQICAIQPITYAKSAHYIRKFGIQTLSNTTALVGNVTTVGTDHEIDSSHGVAITADNTNKSLAITVTGDSSTVMFWTAVISGVEINAVDL